MKNVVIETSSHPCACDARVGIRRGVELAVRGGRIYARSGCHTGPLILYAHMYESHGSPPPSGLYVDPLFCAPKGFNHPELGQPALVRYIGDSFPVRRPARMELVVIAEAQLIWFASSDRNEIQVIELIGSAAA